MKFISCSDDCVGNYKAVEGLQNRMFLYDKVEEKWLMFPLSAFGKDPSAFTYS